MVNVAQLKQLFTPSMYVAADHYREATGEPIEWEIEARFRDDECGIAMRSRRDATVPWTETFISEHELEQASLAGLEWRYRLVSPTAWRAWPLWRRRDYAALVRLFQKHCALVFPVPVAA